MKNELDFIDFGFNWKKEQEEYWRSHNEKDCY